MTEYTVRQVDADGEIVSERHLEDTSADAVLRQLHDINQVTRRVDVYDASDQRVRQIGGDYWRQKYRRSRR